MYYQLTDPQLTDPQLTDPQLTDPQLTGSPPLVSSLLKGTPVFALCLVVLCTAAYTLT